MSQQETLFGEDLSGFEEWWKEFPIIRKQGKGSAKKAYSKAMKKESWPGHEKVMEALRRAKRSRQWQDGYVPMPETWLNQERWMDEWPEDDPPQPTRRSASAAAKKVLR